MNGLSYSGSDSDSDRGSPSNYIIIYPTMHEEPISVPFVVGIKNGDEAQEYLITDDKILEIYIRSLTSEEVSRTKTYIPPLHLSRIRPINDGQGSSSASKASSSLISTQRAIETHGILEEDFDFPIDNKIHTEFRERVTEKLNDTNFEEVDLDFEIIPGTQPENLVDHPLFKNAKKRTEIIVETIHELKEFLTNPSIANLLNRLTALLRPRDYIHIDEQNRVIDEKGMFFNLFVKNYVNLINNQNEQDKELKDILKCILGEPFSKNFSYLYQLKKEFIFLGKLSLIDKKLKQTKYSNISEMINTILESFYKTGLKIIYCDEEEDNDEDETNIKANRIDSLLDLIKIKTYSAIIKYIFEPAQQKIISNNLNKIITNLTQNEEQNLLDIAKVLKGVYSSKNVSKKDYVIIYELCFRQSLVDKQHFIKLCETVENIANMDVSKLKRILENRKRTLRIQRGQGTLSIYNFQKNGLQYRWFSQSKKGKVTKESKKRGTPNFSFGEINRILFGLSEDDKLSPRQGSSKDITTFKFIKIDNYFVAIKGYNVDTQQKVAAAFFKNFLFQLNEARFDHEFEKEQYWKEKDLIDNHVAKLTNPKKHKFRDKKYAPKDNHEAIPGSLLLWYASSDWRGVAATFLTDLVKRHLADSKIKIAFEDKPIEFSIIIKNASQFQATRELEASLHRLSSKKIALPKHAGSFISTRTEFVYQRIILSNAQFTWTGDEKLEGELALVRLSFTEEANYADQEKIRRCFGLFHPKNYLHTSIYDTLRSSMTFTTRKNKKKEKEKK